MEYTHESDLEFKIALRNLIANEREMSKKLLTAPEGYRSPAAHEIEEAAASSSTAPLGATMHLPGSLSESLQKRAALLAVKTKLKKT